MLERRLKRALCPTIVDERMARKSGSSAIPDIKNALRPFFNRAVQTYANNRRPVIKWTSFQTIRGITRPDEFRALYEIIEDKKFYQFPGLGNSFPADRSTIPDATLIRLTPLSTSREIPLQIARLNFYSNQVVKALNALADINDVLERGDWHAAEQLISEFYSDYGYSISIAKKDLLTSFQLGGIIGLNKQYKSLTEGMEGKVWRLYCSFIHDIVDPAYHPSRATKVWLSGMTNNADRINWYAAPLLWQIVGLSGGADYTALQALRYNSVSLLDLVLFLWSLSNVDSKSSEIGDVQKLLNDDIASVLSLRFNKITLPVPPRYAETSGGVGDVNLYRSSFFFSEITNIAVWKAQVSELLFADADSSGSSVNPQNPLASPQIRLDITDKSKATFLTALGDWTQGGVENRLSSEPAFFRALIAADIVRSIKDVDNIDHTTLVKILSETKDVHEYISAQGLTKLAELSEEKDDSLVSFLLRDLAFRRRRSLDNDLERRTAFMNIFVGGTHQDIVPFIISLSSDYPSASDYIFSTCSRVFLERLYLLMSSVKDVIETRIALCQWYIDERDVENRAILEEINALRGELVNLDARSDLDSTRVHVDEEALREWYGETQYGRVARYTQTVLAEGKNSNSESFLLFYNRMIEGPGDMEVSEEFFLSTQIGSQYVLLQIVEDTLKAFVADKSFGMDAYLSRRIRHGTLSGFLITPVSRVVQRLSDDIEAGLGSSELGKAKGLIEEWRALVISKIDYIRRELIQIKSDRHPDALIDPTWRVPSGVTYLDAMIATVRPEVARKGSDYDIFPDIHALCWDLVERDLAKVRLYLLREFTRETSDELSKLFENQPFEVKSAAYPYVLDAQQSMLKRIHEVCGWFIRPVRRKDSYDLRTLISSMTSIVRELDVTYDFVECISVDNGIDINRGTFEVLGDVLFVLLDNAAKHGKKGGEVVIHAALDRRRPDYVNISVTSEAVSATSFKEAVSRVENALQVQDIDELESASVQEGFSGIRKIVGLLDRLRASGKRWKFHRSQHDLTLTFELNIPVQILFRQERA